MRIRAKAIDTLFFRDGKPFTSGEETWADGMFPPYPSVIYGAVRSWFLSNIGKINDHSIEESGKIKIRNIYYKIFHNGDGELSLPLPLDLVEPKEKGKTIEEIRIEKERELNKKTYKVVKLQIKPNTGLSSSPHDSLLEPPSGIKEVEQISGGFIDSGKFKAYLEGKLVKAEIRKINEAITNEFKVGIAKGKITNTALEGKLYRVGMQRPNNISLVIEFDLPRELNNQYKFMKLGGEGKATSISIAKGRIDSLKIKNDSIDLEQGQFKLYLSTPSIFKEGWKPNLKALGIEAELITAVVGKPLNIGGFDMKKIEPKPMLKAVPAGSVYYYKTKEDSQKVIDKLQGKSVSDFLSEQGFGIAFVGNF